VIDLREGYENGFETMGANSGFVSNAINESDL
jgi:hypothetical protein